MAGAERWSAIEDVGRLRDGLGRAGAAGHARRLHRPRRGPDRRPGRAPRPHPRPVHRRRRRRPPGAGHRRRPPDPAAPRPPRAACSTASSAPPARAPSGATPRCCASCAAARWPGCARRSSRSSRTPWAASWAPGSTCGPRRRPRRARRQRSGRPARRRRRAVGDRPARRLPGAGVGARAAGPGRPGARLRDVVPRRADRLRRGRVGRARHPARLRRLGLAAPGRLRRPDPARAAGARALRGRAGGARRPGRRRRLLLPPARRRRARRRRRGERPGALRGAVGAGVGRSGQQRHPDAAARPDPRWQRQPPHPAPTAAGPDGTAEDGVDDRGRRPPDHGAHRPARDRRALGAAARASTPTRPAARTPWPSGCSTGTASSPAAPWSASACPAGSPRSTRCSPPSRTPVAAGVGTSSTGSAPPSSAPRARSTGCAPSPTGVARPDDAGGRDEAPVAIALAATDPANPYGAALAWPAREEGEAGHRPGRKAGAMVVLVDGRLVLYVERGGRTLLTWSDEADLLGPAVGRPRRGGRSRRPGPAHRREGRRRAAPGQGRDPAARGADAGRLRLHPARATTADPRPCLRATPSTGRPDCWTGPSPGTRSRSRTCGCRSTRPPTSSARTSRAPSRAASTC